MYLSEREMNACLKQNNHINPVKYRKQRFLLAEVKDFIVSTLNRANETYLMNELMGLNNSFWLKLGQDDVFYEYELCRDNDDASSVAFRAFADSFFAPDILGQVQDEFMDRAAEYIGSFKKAWKWLDTVTSNIVKEWRLEASHDTSLITNLPVYA